MLAYCANKHSDTIADHILQLYSTYLYLLYSTHRPLNLNTPRFHTQPDAQPFHFHRPNKGVPKQRVSENFTETLWFLVVFIFPYFVIIFQETHESKELYFNECRISVDRQLAQRTWRPFSVDDQPPPHKRSEGSVKRQTDKMTDRHDWKLPSRRLCGR